MVHIVLCTTSIEQKRGKKTPKPLFFCSNLAFAVKQQKPDLIQKTKNRNTSCAHWCFWCSQKGFVSKVHCWCLKKHYFLQVFKVFCLAFKALCFLCWPFLLLVLFLFGFFLTSSCCCLIDKVALFWFLFLLFWVSLVLLCVICWMFWGVFLVFVFLEGLRVRWGGPKGHLTWP